MHASFHSRLLFILGGVAAVFAQTPCGTTQIASQDDANQVSGACSTLDGDLVIMESVQGDIRLDGIETIHGALRNNGSSSVETLSSSTLGVISGALNLTGLDKLTSLSFPQLRSVGGDLHFDTLKKVENITLTNLTSVANFNVTSAAALANLDINKLRNVSASHSSFTIAGVGLDSIANIFATVGSAYFQDNALSILEFENMTITENLFITDNSNLMRIRLPNNMSSTSWNTVDISNNRYISDGVLQHDMSAQWPWGIKRIQNMTFVGTEFETHFFETSTADGSRVDPGIEYIGNLVLESSNTFNCSLLNSLRINGVIKDQYECQGGTVAIGGNTGGDTKDNSSALPGLNVGWLLLGLSMHFLYMVV